jgi:hypothetical protein
MPAQQRIGSYRLDRSDPSVPAACTRRWYDLDGRMYWVHPSSPAAWSRKYLPDGSSKSSISAGLDKPDDGPTKRTGWQLPGGSRPRHPAPGGSPRWRGNVKSAAPRRKREAIVAGRRCSVVAVLVFFAALAGRLFAATSRGAKATSICWSTGYQPACPAVRRLNELGRRGLDPMLPGAAPARGLTSPRLRSGRPVYCLALPARPAPRPGRDHTSAVTEHPSHPNCWSGRVSRVYSPDSNVI